MRKALVILCVVFLAVGVMLVAGCGEEKATTDRESNDTVSLDEPISKGIVGEFGEGLRPTADSKSITFLEGGEFDGDAWGTEKKGTYKVSEKEAVDTVELTFEDGSKETWSIAISVGKVAAILSPEGDQYSKI